MESRYMRYKDSYVKYTEKNKEKIKQLHKIWRLNNKDKNKQLIKKWHKNNPDGYGDKKA